MSVRGLVGCLLRERQRVRPCIMLPSERWQVGHPSRTTGGKERVVVATTGERVIRGHQCDICTSDWACP